MPIYSGIFRDDANAPAAGRIVRAYRRDTGAFLGEATTSDGSMAPGDGDSNFSSVPLLLHMDGVNGSAIFLDNSIIGNAVTAHGGVQISTAASVFGGSSAYFDGVNGYLAAPASGDFVFSGDFTIEAFIRSSSTNANASIFGVNYGSGYNGFQVNCRRGGGNAIQFQYFDGSGYPIINDPNYTDINDSVWRHFAVCRSGTTLRIFLNGANVASGTLAVTLGSAGAPFQIGGVSGSGYYFGGHIDEFRITNGVARYTENFAPPTAQFPESSGTAPAVGSYSISTPHSGEVQVLFMDDVGGVTYNDKIVRVLPP